ncbi:MAG: hypothetical protein QOJ70_848 [Acidobacteriota bacterium]|jgi:hypothetical protein|nr:hypothetical protein [Acidobacteriota bacterium]
MMLTRDGRRRWTLIFFSAALFNYAIGLPIMFARRWSYDLSYVETVSRDPMALRLWADFGFAVVLIGFGYQLISRDVTKNRGIVLLGIIAKLFDVFNLSNLFLRGLAKPVVLIPALIDAAYVALFVAFWFSSARTLAEDDADDAHAA